METCMAASGFEWVWVGAEPHTAEQHDRPTCPGKVYYYAESALSRKFYFARRVGLWRVSPWNGHLTVK